MKGLEKLLLDVTGSTGRMLRDNAFKDVSFEWKGLDNPVTELDKRAERMIKRDILKKMNANFVGEEYGKEDHGAEYTFYIDPIDGTRSFMRKDFLSSVSIGVEHGDKLVAGAVYDFMRDIMYVTCDNEIDLLHSGKRLDIPKRLKDSKIRLNLDGDDIPEKYKFRNNRAFSTMKRGGSIALALAHLAANAYDGSMIFTRGKGNSWDVAGGTALIQSRGFYISDIDGNEFNYKNPNNGIIALNPKAREVIFG